MKSKLKFLTVAATAIMTIGGILFSSCDKESCNQPVAESVGGTLKSGNATIPFFVNFDSVYAEILRSSNYSNPTDYLNHQIDKGFRSIGALSDVFFCQTDLTHFTSLNQALNFYEHHQAMLDTCILERGEVAIVPKWFFSDFRYVANEDGMFAVGGNVFRIFKEGLAYVNMANVNILASLDENQLSSADTTIVHCCIAIPIGSTSGHPSCQKKWNQRNHPTDNSDRIFIEIKTTPVLDHAVTITSVYNLHKTLFFWTPSQHSYSMNATITFHTADQEDNWAFTPKTKSKSGSGFILKTDIYQICFDNISHNVQNYFWFFYNYPDYHHYYSYNITASYPGHSPEVFSFN